MGHYGSAVFFFEQDASLCDDVRPLMLETVAGRPVLSWACDALRDLGVQRFFAAAPARCEAEIRACLGGADVTVSELQSELMAFLDTDGDVVVFPRPAFPFAKAGPGFVYAAQGSVLRGIWKERMTNAVSEAELVPGWLPLYSRATLDEISAYLVGQGAAE